MAVKKFKTIKCDKLSKIEFHIVVEYDGRQYSDRCSLPGLKKNVDNHEDKESLQYEVMQAMYKAITTKYKKKKEVPDAPGTDK